jgi:hypothetical protein
MLLHVRRERFRSFFSMLETRLGNRSDPTAPEELVGQWYRRRMRGVGVLAGLSLTLAACGESSGSSGSPGTGGAGASAGSGGGAGIGGTGGTSSMLPVGPEFEGIYTLDAISINENSCDVEGEDARSSITDTHLLMLPTAISGANVLVVQSCAGVDGCRTLAATLDPQAPVSGSLRFTFTRQPGPRLENTWVFLGQLQSGNCIHSGVMVGLLSGSRAAAVIEQRGSFADHPADSEGKCSVADATAAAKGVPCSELRVIDATFVAEI